MRWPNAYTAYVASWPLSPRADLDLGQISVTVYDQESANGMDANGTDANGTDANGADATSVVRGRRLGRLDSRVSDQRSPA